MSSRQPLAQDALPTTVEFLIDVRKKRLTLVLVFGLAGHPFPTTNSRATVRPRPWARGGQFMLGPSVFWKTRGCFQHPALPCIYAARYRVEVSVSVTVAHAG